MPNYNANAKSLVYGLSDFWTLYFRELPLLEEMYRGMEIDIGQIYLDLLSLLLNNSTQDMSLFNRQFFKLLRLREDTVTYSSDGRYGVALETDIASLKYINNRVFGSTTSLERNIDFVFDENARSVLFIQDIFSAYRARTFGVGNAAFTVTSRVSGASAAAITVEIQDLAVHPPLLTRSGSDLVLQVDSTVTTANDVIALLNTSTVAQGFVKGTLADVSTGQGLVQPSGGVPLQRQATAPLEGFAARTFDVQFGTRFRDSLLSGWLDTDVQKGDVLRIIGGANYGAPQEFPIALVRDGSLLLYPEAAPADVPGELDYVVLRGPVDDTVTGEPFAATGVAALYDTGATLVGATRTLLLNTPLYPPVQQFVGETVILSSALNAGQYTIREAIAVPPSFVLDGNPIADEIGVDVTVRVAWVDARTDGVLSAPNSAGVSVFSSATATNLLQAAGGVLSVVEAGTVRRYGVIRGLSATSLEVQVPLDTVAATGLVWSFAPIPVLNNTLLYAPPNAWPTPGTVVVAARRYLDGQAVQEGRDYTVSPDLGTVTVRSVWQPSALNRVSYQFRAAVISTATPVQSGSNGTLAVGTTTTLTSPSLDLAAAAVGAVLRISNAQLAGNNGFYTIVQVQNATTAVLGTNHVPVLPDLNNGSLGWELLRRGSAIVSDAIEPVTELGAWAPDALIDKYHLYYTYGYLIDRVKTSSEGYRALIRGLFQLFMLGPTLERFESAVNVVAGLPVVRDDGEIFLRYDSGALRSGADGAFDGATRRFTSASANFVPEDLRNQLFVTSGFNANRTFNISAIHSATEVELSEVPTTDSLARWELTATSEHAIVTSRARYVLPRAAPVKSKYLDNLNAGVLTLRAFEVISSAIEVTDYVETPTWWESARIPEVLLPSYTPQRRQSTPALFENVIGASDGASIGDPGFYLGADDTGSVPTPTVLASGLDGAFFGDPLYPSRDTETFFEAASGAFTSLDVGNYILAEGAQYRITAVVSGTRVRIKSYLPLPYDGLPLVAWEHVTGTLPLRHTAAYVILDSFLKYHLFTVRFDAYLLQVLATDVISELQELVFAAKPTYTYLVLTPSLLFDEVVRVLEPEFSATATLVIAGSGGETINANRNDLRLDGSWTLGSWFRYVEQTSSFVAPAASLAGTLGTPDANTERRLSKIFLDPTQFQQSGIPVPYDKPILKPLGGLQVGGSITIVDGDAHFSMPAGGATYSILFNYLELQAPAVNAGLWRIGRVVNDTTVVLDLPGAVAEVGISFQYKASGAQQGRFEVDSEGRSLFYDTDLQYGFGPGDVGAYIRRPYPASTLPTAYRVHAIESGHARLAEKQYLLPTPHTVLLSSVEDYTVTFADIYVDESMAYTNRRTANPATAAQREYYIEITSGTYAGETRRIETYVAPNQVLVSLLGPLDTGVTAIMYCLVSYAGTTTNGRWDIYEPQVVVDNIDGTAAEITMPTAGVDAGVVNYTAYGIQRPLSPIVAVFDETAGDTYYSLGGLDPLSARQRTRTAQDIDLREDPIQITRTAVVPAAVYYITEDGFDMITEDGFNMETE